MHSLLRARLRGGGIGGIGADVAIADSDAHFPKGALLRGKVGPPALLVPGCPGALAELLHECLEDVGRFELIAAPSPLLLDAALGAALGAGAVGLLLLDLLLDPLDLRSG